MSVCGQPITKYIVIREQSVLIVASIQRRKGELRGDNDCLVAAELYSG